MDHAYAEEHGLVESYLKERLSERERESFEAHYFDCAMCLEQLEAASAFREGMLQVAAEDTARIAAARAPLGLLASLAQLSRRRRLALAGALLLLVTLPLALLVANRGLERRLREARAARTAGATAAERRLASAEVRLRDLQQARAGERLALEEELAKARQAQATAREETATGPLVNLPLFTLAAVRGGASGREPVNRVPISASTASIILDLQLAAIDYPAYRASLRDQGDKEIWQAPGLRPDSRDSLVILLPSRMLRPAVYRLAIAGVRPNGAEVLVAVYPFRVVRAPSPAP